VPLLALTGLPVIVAGAPPGDSCTDASGATFVYDREFGFYGLSGYSRYLYRRVPVR